ncbi:homoserine O-acetyltransferase [Calidifontibacter sp. DB0510]|uniref:Homoserine O-acetyltransferase n=1 Tax=Metallococcus carri TaxID=1656884 RepID=A0A967B0H4_9MICO|nr:homoserine O-acetyltransferase [Metallococcus carri]NHN56048.1 homoserine O-acetyltransferase [Metallococcus carri]NOP37495.1 homoserine O-acetyltransferase [Calidifontibacter sp. DB2511S]
MAAADDPFDNPALRAADLGDLPLESGVTLPEVTMAFQTWGTLAPDGSNAVLVEHALTGDAHVVGPIGPGQPTPGWWPGIIGPGRPLDTRDLFVVAPNVLGGCRGTTGPASPRADGRPWGGGFPQITIRDQVAAERRLADLLGIRSWHLVLGGSMGGMRVIEWAATHPERTRTALVIASAAHATADQIAWGHAQCLAIESDPAYHGGDYLARGVAPTAGLGLARRIAHQTYRSADELADRFGAEPQQGEDPLAGGRFAVQSYLDHQAAKLTARFDAGSYLTLTRAMATHDVTRGRGSLAEALAPFTGRLVVAGVDSDRLFPAALSREIVRAHPAGELRLIHSRCGHDGFLVETDQIEAIVADAACRPLADRRIARVG